MAVVKGLEGNARKSDDEAVYFKELDAYLTERVEGRRSPSRLESNDQAATRITATVPIACRMRLAR